MNFWPWRSRPVVTPFTDPFSARVHRWDEVFTTEDFFVSIPSNLYIVPTSIYFRATAIAGIRGVIRNWLYFQRGDITFAGTHIEPTPSNATTHYFIAPIGGISPTLTTLGAKMDCLPYPIYLYPEDRLFFHMDAFLLGDVFDRLTIHGRFWEVY